MEVKLRFLVPYLLLLLADTTLSQVLDCANPADIMFLLDGSDSIDSQEWNQARAFVARMINDFDISPQTINVGITVYSSDIDNHIPLSSQKIVLMARARMLQHPTGITTNTASGIKQIRDTFRASRQNAPKIMIVITDGTSVNPAETLRQAKAAQDEGIRMIAVGVGNQVFVEELQRIASNQRKYYPVADFNALRSIEADLRAMVCRVITTTRAPPVTFRPPTPPPGFIPLPEDRICNVPGDIVFVIDGSDSISDGDYVRLKNFVANLIDNFEIGPDAIHVGMIVYSTLIGETIGLRSAQSKVVLKALAKNLDHPKFGTDTAAGIEAARNMINAQGRPTAPEIIVVITDGRSTNPRNTILQANRAKADGITMLAVGVGKDIFQTELNQIASTANLVSVVRDFSSLANTVNFIRNLICTSITTTSTTTTSMMPPTPPPKIDPPPIGLDCKVPGDVVFLLDGSQSINQINWRRQKNFVANLIDNLEVGPRYIHVSIIVYSSEIGDVIPLNPYKPKSELSARVKQLTQPRDATDTALGIAKAAEMMRGQGRPNAPKVIIVITDGKSTFMSNTRIQAAMAKADGNTMIAVGVGQDIFEDELRSIATSERKVFKVVDFTALQDIIGQLRDKICQVVQTTTIAPTTPSPTPPPTTQMTTPSTVPLYPCGESYTAADIIFMIDGSLSSRPYEWMMKTHFVTNFLDGVEIQNEYVHVGAVISDHVSQRGDVIGISPFQTRAHLKELIHGMISPRGGMDTVRGLQKVNEIFQTSRERPLAHKIMILVTDGNSKKYQQTLQEAAHLKNGDVTVVSVGVGNNVDIAELRNIASHPSLVVRSYDFNGFLQLLPELQRIICAILGQPITTTPAPTTPSQPGLCDGCLIANGVGYNPYPGDCTKFVQCWKDGENVKALVRSCPFGQFWDADAITCRPSFLVKCTADPCLMALPGFTYGMPEYGCRAYWKCIDGFSVGHCCSEDSAYVEGMGCLEDIPCFDKCPPEGGIAVRPTCDRRPHWDKRYYIEIIHGRGEMVRPCPAGTVYVHERCGCDFGMSGLLPTEPQVMCKPAAFFPFDADLKDHSMNQINTGITNVARTDLGTAYFNGNSEMNLWRFAGADWGNTLVIKFKFRFDYANKFVDYGGLPVDLGSDWRINMNLLKDFKLTNLDWRLWNQMKQVQNIDQWRQLLKEFGKTKMFYIFLGQLGFKPGTSNSVQVIRILGTPEAYREIKIMLDQLRSDSMATAPTDMQGILAKLRSLRGYINWTNIVKQLQEKGGSIDTGSGNFDKTTPADVANVTGAIPHGAVFIRKYNHLTGQWEIVPGSGPGMTLGPDEAEWRWNSLTQNWERTVVTGNSGASGGSTGSSWQTGSGSGSSWGGGAGATGGSWQTQTHVGGKPGTANWEWSAGTHQNQSTSSNFGGFFTWQDLMREIQRIQQQRQGAGFAGGATGGATGGAAGGGWQWQSGGQSGGGAGGATDGSWQWQSGGQSGGAASGGAGGGWQWQSGGQAGGQSGGQSGNLADWGVNAAVVDEILRQLQIAAQAGMEAEAKAGMAAGSSGGMSAASGGMSAGASGGMSAGASGGMVASTSGGLTAGGSGTMGADTTGGMFAGTNTGMPAGSNEGMTGGSSWQWSSSSGSTGGTNTGTQLDMAKLQEMLKQIQQASSGTSWNSGISGTQLDTQKLNAFLKQLQAATNGTSWSSGSGWSTSGNWSSSIPTDMFITSGGKAAQISGGMGSNSGLKSGISKRIIETRIEKAKPKTEPAFVVPVTGGRIVGGTVSGTISQTQKTSPELGGASVVMTGFSQGSVKGPQEQVVRQNAPTSAQIEQNKVLVTGQVKSQGSPLREQMVRQEFVDTFGEMKRPVIGGEKDFNIVRQKVQVKQNANTPQWIPARQAPRGAAAKGVRSDRVEGEIVGMSFPSGSGIISGGTIFGNTGIQEVPVINTGPRLRIKEIVQEVNPVPFSSEVQGTGGGTVVETQRRVQSRLVPGQTTGTFSKTVQLQGGSGGGAAASGFSGSARGAAGRWALSGEGSNTQFGGLSGMSGGAGGVGTASSGSGMAGGDFTQMGKVFGTGGGIKRVIDTNMKRIPAGMVQLEASGGVDLASLGLGGAEGSNIIRRTVQLSGGEGGDAAAAGGNTFSSQGGNFIDIGTTGGRGSFASGQTVSRAGGSGGAGGNFIDIGTTGGGSSFASGQTMSSSGGGNSLNDLMFLTGISRESTENLLDIFAGKRKRRSAPSRSKRATNKQAYQALVTNCQGQGVQGPSIMIVANDGDVQFALKTKGSKQPGVISVPAVEGWNDVTLVYDGQTLTGIVENWKGYHKSSINLSGNIERRQAGLLVGSCQGFASFHGEIDDLTVYNCITPAMKALRDRMVI